MRSAEVVLGAGTQTVVDLTDNAERGAVPRLPPATHAGLFAVLETGPVRLYCSYGFTGFANPKCTLDGPPALSRQAFERLRKRGFLHRLGKDEFKELWDISESGLAYLAQTDWRVASMEPTFRARRLATPLQTYAFDKYGLISRAGRGNPAAQATQIQAPSVASLAQSRTRSDAVLHAEERATAVSAHLDHNEVGLLTLGRAANACLEVADAFLVRAGGAVGIDITLRIENAGPLALFPILVPKSFDSEVTDVGRSALKHAFATLQPHLRIEAESGCAATLSLSVWSKKAPRTIRTGRLPHSFSILDLVAQVREAVVPLRPARLARTHKLRFRFSAERRTERIGVAELEWQEPHGSWYRSVGRRLAGEGSVKATGAAEVTAAIYVSNLQLTFPPIRRLDVVFDIQCP